MINLKTLNDVDPMRLAWLLRPDLRHGAPAGAQMSDWFRMWWLVHGQREYPAWRGHATLREAGLFRPQSECPSYGGFGMTPALRFLLDTRADLGSEFDVNTTEGLQDAIAWLFVHGVREHQLALALDEQTLAKLNATPHFLANSEPTEDDEPELTWLMFFVWSTHSELKKRFNLEQIKDKQAYLAWFLLNAVPKLKLSPMLIAHWHNWLREPVLLSRNGNEVPRATHLLWGQYQQLQSSFDLQTDSGITALAMWSTEVWHTQSELSWIDQLPIPLTQEISLPAVRPFGVNLIGFAFGELGIGEDVRMAVAACEAANIPFVVVNISPGDHLRQADQALAEHVAEAAGLNDTAPYAINLFCLTAFDTARVALEHGATLFEGRYNIGWWPWELPVWPRDWLCVFNLVNEVWAATTFTARMYSEAVVLASATPTPVTLMPMAVSVERGRTMTRKSLGLPEDVFLFLYIFDFNSYLKRKNPLSVIEAFRKAFPTGDRSVGLVLKTMNSQSENLDWKNFVRACQEDSRIKLFDTTLERSAVLGLIQACDAYVSLHRSEGFGRTLAEAMLFGKPVIGTNYSGNTDFLNEATGFPVEAKFILVNEGEYPFITEADRGYWADPCVSNAAEQLVLARKEGQEPAFSRSIQRFANYAFSPVRTGQRMRNFLASAISSGHCTE